MHTRLPLRLNLCPSVSGDHVRTGLRRARRSPDALLSLRRAGYPGSYKPPYLLNFGAGRSCRNRTIMVLFLLFNDSHENAMPSRDQPHAQRRTRTSRGRAALASNRPGAPPYSALFRRTNSPFAGKKFPVSRLTGNSRQGAEMTAQLMSEGTRKGSPGAEILRIPCYFPGSQGMRDDGVHRECTPKVRQANKERFVAEEKRPRARDVFARISMSQFIVPPAGLRFDLHKSCRQIATGRLACMPATRKA